MIQLTCPSCHAGFTLDVLFSHEAARRAFARLAQIGLPFGALTLQYLALFRPESRALSIDKLVRLVEQLLPDIQRGAITHRGRDWEAGVETWRAAIDVLLAKRAANKLRLPLTSHALLYEVMSGMAELVEAAAERDVEESRRRHRHAGPLVDAPQAVGAVVASAAQPEGFRDRMTEIKQRIAERRLGDQQRPPEAPNEEPGS